MLQELIALYRAPDFQAQLVQAYTEYCDEEELQRATDSSLTKGNTKGHMIFSPELVERRRVLCMPQQASVITRYGFEATQDGVLRSYAACMVPGIADVAEFQQLNWWIGYLIHSGPAALALQAKQRAAFLDWRWQALVRGAVLAHVPQGAAVLCRPGSATRQAVLEALEEDGSLLDSTLGYRRDADAVLAAISNCPEAMRSACLELQLNRSFALEAVRRNWRVLGEMPDVLRTERRVITAALAQSPEARELAHRVMRPDSTLVAATGDGYGGEFLRLVGHCCCGRLNDACLRFAQPVALPADDDRVRHRLTVHLRSGCLSFQIVSCTRGLGLKIFLPEAGPDGFFRLRAGSTVTASLGSEDEGCGHDFYVDEEPGAVVSIYVELAVGACAGVDTASVWLVAEGRRLPTWAQEVPSLSQERDHQLPRFKLAGSDLYDAMVLEDVDATGKFHDLARQALGLHEKYFSGTFEMRAVTGGRHLTLLIKAEDSVPMGYCIYTIVEQEGHMWIENLLVLEEFRRRGVGRALIRWASARASTRGCGSIRLKSNAAAAPFYRSVGFRVVAGKDELMELRLAGGAAAAELDQ